MSKIVMSMTDEFDGKTKVVRSFDSCITISDVTQVFFDFLNAVGYSNETIELMKDRVEDIVEILY